MKDHQMIQEFQTMLNELCPDLHLDVQRSRSAFTIFSGVGCLLYNFPIDKFEWIKNVNKTTKIYLIQHRLLESLTNLQNQLNSEIEKIKQW
jgi:hypothetical protein